MLMLMVMASVLRRLRFGLVSKVPTQITGQIVMILASTNPMATDIVGDGIDQNCDDVDGTDTDGDGYASIVSGGDDCEDADADINPGRPRNL